MNLDELYRHKYRNDSGEAVPPFGVLKITGYVAVETGGLWVLKADKPDTYGSQTRHFVNGPESIPNGDYGRCAVPTDPVWIAYDTSDTPAVGESWGPVDDSWEVEQYVGGFEIVGDPDTTNEIVLAVQRPMFHVVGKTDAAHDFDDTGTISIYHGGTKGSETDSTYNFTGVYNRFADVESTKWVALALIGEDWELISAEC